MMMRLVVFVFVFVFAFCALAAGTAHGLDAAVRLAWRAPAGQGCPTDAQIRASVEERLGRPVFERIDDGSAFTVRGSLEPAEERGSWRARVALLAPDGELLGERIVVASDPACDALRGPLAIIVSLLVEQHRERIVLYEPPSVPPAVARAAAVEPSVAPPSEPPSGVTFGFQIGATLRGLALPGPAFGLRQVLRFGWEGVPFAVGLEAQIAPPFTYAIDAAASELWYWSAGATLCPVFFEEPAVRSVTCAGVMLGQSYARGVGFSSASTTGSCAS